MQPNLFSIETKRRNLLLHIGYDGRNYHGWQIQKNASTVQEVFQKALLKILDEKVDIKGCSRTDSGVHAYDYCISFKTSHSIPCERLVAALNRHLPKDIAVFSCEEVPKDFHARYSCKGKEYIYKIWNRDTRDPFLNGYVYHYRYPIDEKQLNKAAKAFIGTHNFASFCTLDRRKSENMTRTVRKAEVERRGNMVLFAVEADGFLYNMVRIMVGTLLRISQGKIKENEICDIIRQENRNCAGPTAIPDGLYLNKVYYDKE